MHKFHLGQPVEYSPPRGIDAPRGAYVVTAKLPERDGQFEYRIHDMNEQHERMARESELQALDEGIGLKITFTGDFTCSGTNDVLLQNGGTVVDWIMQNGQYQSGNVFTTAAAGWNVVGTGDYNGDGTSDVLLQNGGTVVDWIMKNGAFQSGNVITNGGAGFQVART